MCNNDTTNIDNGNKVDKKKSNMNDRKDNHHQQQQQKQRRQLPSYLQLRSFHFDDINKSDDDSKQCEALELRANQFKNGTISKIPILKEIQNSIQVCPSYGNHGMGGHMQILPGIHEYEIIVCEDVRQENKNKNKNKIVGVISCIIVPVTWNNNTKNTTKSSSNIIKVGWVFGLRVDEEYQRLGIGRALQIELESRCITNTRHKVNMLYLTVNDNNHKAKKFYHSLGWQHGSYRKASSKVLLNHRNKKIISSSSNNSHNDKVVFHIKNPTLAASIIAQYKQYHDLTPVVAVVPGGGAESNEGNNNNNNNNDEILYDSIKAGIISMLTKPNNEEELFLGTFICVKQSQTSDEVLELLKRAELIDDSKKSDATTTTEKEIMLLSEQLEQVFNTNNNNNNTVPSYGVISLWNSSQLKHPNVIRFIFTKDTWLSPIFQYSMVTIILSILSLWFKRILYNCSNAYTSSTSVRELSSILILPIILLLLEIVVFLFITKYTLLGIQTVFNILSTDKTKLQCRGFAPYHYTNSNDDTKNDDDDDNSNNDDLGMECLQYAIESSWDYAASSKHAMWIFNMDSNSNYAWKFGNKAFEAQFLQKWLLPVKEQEQEEQKQQKWQPFSPLALCDPRYF